VKSGQYLQWHDLFVLIDDGTISSLQYMPIEEAMREQAKQFPHGIAILCILPPGTNPPPEDIKQKIKELLARMGPSLSSLTYLVEGTGFKGVATRATLVGLAVFASRPYPIYVEATLRDALTKIYPHLAHGQTVTSNVKVIMKVITDARSPASALSGTDHRVAK